MLQKVFLLVLGIPPNQYSCVSLAHQLTLHTKLNKPLRLAAIVLFVGDGAYKPRPLRPTGALEIYVV